MLAALLCNLGASAPSPEQGRFGRAYWWRGCYDKEECEKRLRQIRIEFGIIVEEVVVPNPTVETSTITITQTPPRPQPIVTFRIPLDADKILSNVLESLSRTADELRTERAWQRAIEREKARYDRDRSDEEILLLYS